MAKKKRILLIAGEVTPFAQASELADLVRQLPEHLTEHGDFEARITMPRYGTINERRNQLHEVIRLSDTDITMGDDQETLTVKVASIPDTRLQVYFMDHDGYFGRKAIAHDADGEAFDDNGERALFYSRAVLETISKLRWGPDIVHAFGWVSSLAPLLLNTEYAGNDLLSSTRVVYTPDSLDTTTQLSGDFADRMHLKSNGDTFSQPLASLGSNQADAAIAPPSYAANGNGRSFGDSAEVRGNQLIELYQKLLSEVPA